jgi:hypothetical protein
LVFPFIGQVGRSVPGTGVPDATAVTPNALFRTPEGRFDRPRAVDIPRMDLKKPLVLLALVGSLVACGDNTNLDRGETNCDSTGEEASNPQDAGCEEEGPEDD